MEKESGDRLLLSLERLSSKLEHWPQLFAVRMLVTTKMTSSKAEVNSIGLVATITLATTQMMKGTALAKCAGWMAVCTKVNGCKIYSMGMDKCSFQMARLRKASLRTTPTKFKWTCTMNRENLRDPICKVQSAVKLLNFRRLKVSLVRI